MNAGAENSAGLDRWLDLRRLREYATVSNRTLRAWIHSPVDPLPAARVGTKILVRRSEFDAWMERHRIKQVDLGCIVEEVMEGLAGGR
jgi:excisionase family DNA binding protein